MSCRTRYQADFGSKLSKPFILCIIIILEARSERPIRELKVYKSSNFVLTRADAAVQYQLLLTREGSYRIIIMHQKS